MMKLVKLENNQFIYLDNFWHNNGDGVSINSGGDGGNSGAASGGSCSGGGIYYSLRRSSNNNTSFSFNNLTFAFILIVILSTNLIRTTTAQSNELNNNNNINNNTVSTTTVVTQKASTSTLTTEHATMFQTWLESISAKLYDLSSKYSGFNVLNDTYHQALKHAEPEWINFTSMIINISNTISDVLHNKTLIVKNLSEKAEEEYEAHADNDITNDELKDSYHYYNAKKNEIFCDTLTAAANKTTLNMTRFMNGTNSTLMSNMTLTNSSNSSSSTISYLTKSTPIPTILTSPTNKNNKPKHKRLVETDDFYIKHKPHHNNRTKYSPHIHHTNKSHYKHHLSATHDLTTTSKITTQIDVMDVVGSPNFIFNDEHTMEEESLHDYYDPELKSTNKMLNLTCLTRRIDQRFSSRLAVNYSKSTVHVPTNVFDEDLKIKSTAQWSENLDYIFQENHEQDSELFWQYFCSSDGLFRRYPGAHWNKPIESDFFDCRVQSWYISAAASPKDVIILLDTSGSMTGLRLEIAKRLIDSIMDTLTDNDFFNIITFSDSASYLMNLNNETSYRNRFVQAGYYNKLMFAEKLKWFKNTSSVGEVHHGVKLAFQLFHSNTSSSSESCGCNKVMMIITDGATDEAEQTFKEQNEAYGFPVRVFTFLIGREMTNPRAIEWIACFNNGGYYHVATLADVNEHVHEYIPVLSKPMAMYGVKETRWSNVFIGHLDAELKIAVARPAFKNITRMEERMRRRETLEDREKYFVDDDQLLLGVVGVDIPVLRLMSKVSPKYQMGVGIYIIMLDNNGYIVFHPSIKEEMKKGELDHKGRSHSVDINHFEIPIDNEKDFEQLEHNMVDQKTNNVTLKNYKREGVRVIKRETEYVYTPVRNTPFSVAIASPKSFGRYYIYIPTNADTEEKMNKDLVKLHENLVEETKIITSVQLYNCSYNFSSIVRRIVKSSYDYCLTYSSIDHDQIFAIKSDLKIHETVYDRTNFSIFTMHKYLVRSSFYGTYSGLTFYLPVIHYRNVSIANATNTTSMSTTNIPLNTEALIKTNEPKIEPTMELEAFPGHSRSLGKNNRATYKITTAIPSTTTKIQNLTNLVEEAYNQTVNMFSTEDNKYSFSFEKQYYTRAVEFSDYMRTEYNETNEIVIYFLNESSKDAKRDTIGATLSVWLKNVPTAVAGVVYDAKRLQDLVFEDKMQCGDESCANLCSKQKSHSANVTCYLVDEHGIVIMSTTEMATRKELAVGLPLYKANPWLMKNLEKNGIFELIIPGTNLTECRKPPESKSCASLLYGFISRLSKLIGFILNQIGFLLFNLWCFVSFTLKNVLFQNGNVFYFNTAITTVESIKLSNSPQHKIENAIISNSYCYYFGIYSLNMSKAQLLDSSEISVWCNEKRYLVGYIKRSNLIMLIVENEPDITKCGNVFVPPKPVVVVENDKTLIDSNATSVNKTAIVQTTFESLNRYRKQPESCYTRHPNETKPSKCVNGATNLFSYNNIFLILFSNYLFLCVSLFMTVFY